MAFRSVSRVVRSLTCALFILLSAATQAFALEPVDVSGDIPAIDLTNVTEAYRVDGDGISVTAAPDANGVVNRIEVRSESDTGAGGWLAFALANPSTEQIDRLIVAPHFRLPGSGLFWPEMGHARLVSITPSAGFALDRQPAQDADIFRITLNPETVVTFVVELTRPAVPQLTLWEPDAYKDAVNSTTLYSGIVLGIAGLLALFLTILFVVKGSIMFPATAALAWSVLAYVSVDFGFISKIVALDPEALNIYRAGTEVFLAASLVLFLWAYLHLNRWNVRYNYLVLVWLVALTALLAVATIAPAEATGLARVSIALTAMLGLLLIGRMAIGGFDRAVLLVPAWILLGAWVFGGWMTVTGQLDNDIIQPALGGGLVLIVLLVSFTVMQHAFAGGGVNQGLVSDMERQALALVGAGDSVWDWDVDRDELIVGPEVSNVMGLEPDALSGSPSKWSDLIHPQDRDRFKACLDVVLDHRRGRIEQDFRLRGKGGQYHWLSLRARPVIGSDGEVLRCVGTLSDVTGERIARQRLLVDAVHDNVTGLPNGELFNDRLKSAISLAAAREDLRPTLFMIDLDGFENAGDGFELSVDDSILMTVTRRMSRLLKAHDALARLGGERFGLLLLSEPDPEGIAVFADALQRALKAPVIFSRQELLISASIGLVTWSSDRVSAEEFMHDSELAVMQAKRTGGGRVEPFRPSFRTEFGFAGQLEKDLETALERAEIDVYYQPIVRLETGRIAGLEALVRWHHPVRGTVSPGEFIPLAERKGLISRLGHHIMQRAAHDLSQWQQLHAAPSLFVSVNISSRQLLKHDLVNDVKAVLEETRLAEGTLKLELTELLVMENPEQSSRILQDLRDLGTGLSMDDFGTGYSSLSQLMRFPFDTIKIDRSFVTNREGGGGRPVILRSIIGMAHDLGMEVVAEGAEDESDALELLQLGCEYGQGFVFGEPMRANDVDRTLKLDKANS